MTANYTVTGIVQLRINGAWHEQPTKTNLYAVDREHAQEKALKLCAKANPTADVVRWYARPRVAHLLRYE